MSISGPNSGVSRGPIRELLDSLSGFGFQIGGIIFGLTAAYLLWGLFGGKMAEMSSMTPQDVEQTAQNVRYACTGLVVAGIVFMLSAAIRFSEEEVLGYLFLIVGVALYWGIPTGVAASAQGLDGRAAQAVGFVVSKFQLLGITGLALAIPFIGLDFWYRVVGIRTVRRKNAAAAAGGRETKTSDWHLFCWQMPYCRTALRKHCKAYQQRKPCWWIKCGCYCDDELAARAARKAQGASAAGFDQNRGGQPAKTVALTDAQKAERCRNCFLYAEHQKVKYRILSPLAFPITFGAMWLLREPIMGALKSGLNFIDWLVKQFSFTHSGEAAAKNPWGEISASSDAVVWMFMICISLMVATFILRGLEWLIFDRQC